VSEHAGAGTAPVPSGLGDGRVLDTDPEPTSLRRAGATGVMWQGLAYVFGKLVVAATTVALARMIAPEQFGLVALATVLITFSNVVSDGGVAQALVYLETTRETTRSAMLVALTTGGLMAGAVAVLAPALARFFDNPEVADLTRVLSLVLLLGSLASVPEALLRRKLLYRRLAWSSVLRAVVIGVTSIGLAVAGWEAWAIVWGTVAGALTYTVAMWWMMPAGVDLRLWRVRRRDLGAVVRYGLPAALGILLSRLIFDVDYLIVGRQLGAEALGFYTVAFRLPELAIVNVFFVISSVTFPLYSRARADPERLRSGYCTSVRIQSVYGVSAGVGLAIIAPVAVPTLFGDRWLPAVECLAALGLYAALRSVGAGANDVYKAIGRPSITVWVSLLRLAVLLPALILAADHGIAGVAWTQAALAGCFAVLMQGVATRVIGLRPGRFVRAIAPAFACGCAVAVTVSAVVYGMPGSDPTKMWVGILVGALTVVGVVRLCAPEMVVEVRSTVRRKR